MNKPRVLHLITGLERGGGAENMLLNIVPKLKGHNVVCVLKGRGEIAQELEDKGVKIFYLDIKNPVNLNYIFKYRKVIKEFEPDIQINYLIHADIFGRIFGKLFKVPKVVSYIRNRHEENFFFFLDHVTLFLADSVLVNSKPLIDFYTKRHGVIRNKINFISNAVDMENIQKLSKEKVDFNFDINKKYIISTARLHHQKDIPTLIRAFKIISEKYSNYQLILANDGPEISKILPMISKMTLEDRVHIIGKKENIYPYIVNSDIFALTSKFEGMSNALLEAVFLDLLVIVSDIPENIQIVKGDKQSVTFEVGSYLDFAEKCISLIESYDSVKNSDLRLEIKERYSLKKIIKVINNFIHNNEL